MPTRMPIMSPLLELSAISYQLSAAIGHQLTAFLIADS